MVRPACIAIVPTTSAGAAGAGTCESVGDMMEEEGPEKARLTEGTTHRRHDSQKARLREIHLQQVRSGNAQPEMEQSIESNNVRREEKRRNDSKFRCS